MNWTIHSKQYEMISFTYAEQSKACFDKMIYKRIWLRTRRRESSFKWNSSFFFFLLLLYHLDCCCSTVSSTLCVGQKKQVYKYTRETGFWNSFFSLLLVEEKSKPFEKISGITVKVLLCVNDIMQNINFHSYALSLTHQFWSVLVKMFLKTKLSPFLGKHFFKHI